VCLIWWGQRSTSSVNTVIGTHKQNGVPKSSVWVCSGVSGKQVLPVFCVVCGCKLNGDNRSDVVNVCKFCQHSLES